MRFTSIRENKVTALLLIALVVVNLFVYIMSYMYLASSKEHYLMRSRTDSVNITHTLSQNINDTLEKVDISLLALKDSIDRQMAQGGIDKAHLNRRIYNVFSRLSGLEGIRVSDKNGMVTYGVKVKDRPSVSITHQAHFIYLKNHPEADAVLTQPIFGKISQRWTIKVVRRYNYPNGAFAGVITGIVDLKHFVSLFSAVDVGSKGVIVLRDGDLKMLARYPNPKGIGRIIGLANFPDAFKKAVEDRPDLGTLEVTSAYDFIHRTIAYHKIGKWPLLLHVGLATDDYLSEWYATLKKVILAAALFSLSTILLSWLLYRELRKRQALAHALQESRAMFREFAEMASDGFWEMDADARFVRVSSGFQNILGAMTEAQMMGKRPWDLQDMSCGVICSDFQEAVALNQAFDDVECSFVNLIGDHKSILVSGRPILDAQGKITGYRGTGKDISERKRYEQALSLSHQIYQNILGTTLDGFIEMDRSGRILDVNQSYCERSGYRREELLQMSVSDLHDGATSMQVKTRFEELFQTGRIMFETTHRRRDGHLWDVEINATLMALGGGRFQAFVRDITERKRAAEKLHASMTLVTAFLDNLPGLAYAKDGQQRFIIANKGFDTLLGIETDDLIGKTEEEFFESEGIRLIEKINTDGRRVLSTGETEVLEEIYQGRHYHFIKFAVEDDTRQRILCGLAIDVTEQHLLREREKALLELREVCFDLSVNEMLPEALKIVERLLESEISYVDIVHEDRKKVARYHGSQIWATEARPQPLFSEEAIWAACLREKLPQIVNNAADYRLEKNIPDWQESIERFILVPILEAGEVCMLMAAANKASAYDENDVTTMTLIGEQLWGMSRRTHALKALQESHDAYTDLLAVTQDGFWCVDTHGSLLDVNRAYCEQSGYSREELLSLGIADLEAAFDAKGIAQQIQHIIHFGNARFETEHRRKDGTVWQAEISVTFHHFHGGQMFAFIRDITERKQYQMALQHMASKDDLTGLYNRRHVMETARHEYRRAVRLEQNLSIALIDLDHFKNVNDKYGHDVGDKVLQALASVFRAHIREIDIMGRLGGDEFALLLPSADATQALAIVERARTAFAESETLHEAHLPIPTFSCGIAQVGDRVGSLDAMIKQADRALYEAKRKGRNQTKLESEL